MCDYHKGPLCDQYMDQRPLRLGCSLYSAARAVRAGQHLQAPPAASGTASLRLPVPTGSAAGPTGPAGSAAAYGRVHEEDDMHEEDMHEDDGMREDA